VTSDLSLADRPIEIPQVFPDLVTSPTTGKKEHADWTKDPALSEISIVKKKAKPSPSSSARRRVRRVRSRRLFS
jgi:hypothetical protein